MSHTTERRASREPALSGVEGSSRAGDARFSPASWIDSSDNHAVTVLELSASRSHPRDAEVLHRPVDYRLEFVRVFDFAAFGQDNARLFCVEPAGIAKVFLGTASLADFHQESLDHIFLHTACLPEDALRVNIDVEMTRLNDADGARFFLGFAFSRLAVREARFGRPLGKRPLAAAVGMDQQKLGMRIHPPVADGSDLQGQSKTRDPREAHHLQSTAKIFQEC